MPSYSYNTFLSIQDDAHRLWEDYMYFQTLPQKNNTDYSHLIRSAMLMLCAAWERYNEDLLLESIAYLCLNLNSVEQLNLSTKKYLSNKVKNEKNELKPIELAGDGWKNLWLEYAKKENGFAKYT